MMNNQDSYTMNTSSLEEFSLEEFSAPAAGQAASASAQQAIPDARLLEGVLAEANTKKKFKSVIRSTIGTLLVVAAIAALIAMFVLPILQIHGTSMTPTIVNGEIVVALKGSTFKKGDVIGLYIGNKLLVKRVIGGAGDWIDIKSDGTVFVNGEMISEPYVTDKAFGDCNINLPYQVPDGRYFVMGDHRSTSADSRNTAIGCIAYEQIVGRIVFRIWPFSRFGRI